MAMGDGSLLLTHRSLPLPSVSETKREAEPHA